jgi:hypothetical protein
MPANRAIRSQRRPILAGRFRKKRLRAAQMPAENRRMY